MLYICLLIILLYTIIHFLEFSSFYSRISGINTGYKLLSYSVQQTTFVFTRFFFIFLMPLLGFVIDQKISRGEYLATVLLSLFGSSLSYTISFSFRRKIIMYFERVILNFKNNGYIKSFYLAVINQENILQPTANSIFKINKGITILASLIFSCYSIAVFLSFYFALVFYDYRTTISQLSGVINAFATLVLTIYIEPRISKAIDNKSDGAENDVYSLLLGRFLGVSIISPIVILLVALSL